MPKGITRFGEIYGRLVQLATAIAGLLLSAFPYPASLYAWPKVLILGSWVVSFLSIRTNRRYTRIVLAISMIIGLGSGFAYWVFVDSMAIEVESKVYIRGELTDQAQEYLKKYPTVSEKEYFIQSGKNEDWVWKPESRRMSRILLGSLYSIFIFFFGLSIMGALEIYARSKPQSD
ncbi:MAG: hypothetical protein JRI58_13730 [Deltaproteobacteria bacterium]|nr:hypothetical protein [Deltaproteobacteria bacterium]